MLKPVHPNIGLEVLIRKRLLALVDEMHNSVLYWLKATWRANPPVLAQDALPARELQSTIRQLTRQWQGNINDAAPRLARWFTTAIHRRSDAVLKDILREAGMSVRWQMSRAMRDAMRATIGEQVGLIKSIPQKYLSQVETLVMQSVTTGRDLATLTNQLEKQFKVTRRRAHLIARDQNNKATATMTRVRQQSLGIEEAIWMHSGGGRERRPTHLANNGKRYNVSEGWYDPHEKRHIHTGELINCFPGSSRLDFAHDVEKAYRHWHCGDLAEIVTDSGKTLRATPNHPVLTLQGWVAAGALHEGDYVLEIANHGIDSIVPESNADHAPPTLAQVFETLAQKRVMRFEISLRDQFHGDGSPDGNVDIVDAANGLCFGAESLLTQCKFDIPLAKSNEPRLGARLGNQFMARRHRTSPRLIGGHRKTLAPFDTLALHSFAIGVAPIPDRSASGDYATRNHGSGNAVQLCESQDTETGLMLLTKPARIIRVYRPAFEGHVYNLQTASGWYVTEGIVTHNCRCISKSIVPGFS